jgi:hypothetical protein
MPNAFIFCCLVAGGPVPPQDPPLSDLERFPPVEVVQNELAMNQTFQDYLNARLDVALHQQESLGAQLRRAEFFWNCWDDLRDAQCSYYTEDYRRRRLADLRRRIGDYAYYRGLMPPGVPYWDFPEIE